MTGYIPISRLEPLAAGADPAAQAPSLYPRIWPWGIELSEGVFLLEMKAAIALLDQPEDAELRQELVRWCAQ